MKVESRQAEVRMPLMVVKPMTQQGQWVCFGLDRAFAYKTETVELEAPNDANSKLQDIMDIMMTEKRLNRRRKSNI